MIEVLFSLTAVAIVIALFLVVGASYVGTTLALRRFFDADGIDQ